MNRVFKSIAIGVSLALAVLWCVPKNAEAGGTAQKSESEGTVTWVINLDVDSLKSMGTDHNSPDAVKSPWFAVPFGVPFAVYIESRDADSSLIFGGDTIHTALESAPEGSMAVTSTNSKFRRHPQLVFNSGSVNFKNWPQRDYFFWSPADTNATDTLAVAAASNKTGAFGGAAALRGFGMYRFSVCGDDADSVTDGTVRLRAILTYQAKERNKGL